MIPYVEERLEELDDLERRVKERYQEELDDIQRRRETWQATTDEQQIAILLAEANENDQRSYTQWHNEVGYDKIHLWDGTEHKYFLEKAEALLTLFPSVETISYMLKLSIKGMGDDDDD